MTTVDYNNTPQFQDRRRVQMVSRNESHLQTLISVVGASLSTVLLMMMVEGNELSTRLDERVLAMARSQEEHSTALNKKLDDQRNQIEEVKKQVEELKSKYQNMSNRFYDQAAAETLLNRLSQVEKQLDRLDE